jgi:hypothetical protein
VPIYQQIENNLNAATTPELGSEEFFSKAHCVISKKITCFYTNIVAFRTRKHTGEPSVFICRAKKAAKSNCANFVGEI